MLLIFSVVRSYTGMKAAHPFMAADKRAGLFLLISAHTTLLIGLYQWITGPWGLKNIENMGMSAVMKDDVYRFYAIEHMTGMIIAIVLITIGRSATKKAIPDQAKFKKAFWFYLIALIIILASVPWPFRAGVGRPWI
jgi:hypothetical protein